MNPSSSALRIFSYLPNPRVWKATIAARLLNIELEVVGAKPAELADWLWDFDAHELAPHERGDHQPYARQGKRGFNATLYKTDDFLRTQPFATVPCAFSPDGQIGVFESNSILRAVARAAGGDRLYGDNAYSTSRIDSFLDADLVFAREAQVYLLELQNNQLTDGTYQRMNDAYGFFLAGVNQALNHSPYLATDHLTLADIAFLCDFSQFQRELYFTPQLRERGLNPISEALGEHLHPQFSNVSNNFDNIPAYLTRCLGIPEIAKDLAPYVDDLRQKLLKTLEAAP